MVRRFLIGVLSIVGFVLFHLGMTPSNPPPIGSSDFVISLDASGSRPAPTESSPPPSPVPSGSSDFVICLDRSGSMPAPTESLPNAIECNAVVNGQKMRVVVITWKTTDPNTGTGHSEK